MKHVALRIPDLQSRWNTARALIALEVVGGVILLLLSGSIRMRAARNASVTCDAHRGARGTPSIYSRFAVGVLLPRLRAASRIRRMVRA